MHLLKTDHALAAADLQLRHPLQTQLQLRTPQTAQGVF